MIIKTPIPGLLIIKKPTFKDNRGYFREVIRIRELEKVTRKKFNFKQWSHSWSKPRVIRALHAEEQNKIIYPISGHVFSVYVDVRLDSETFGKTYKIEFKEPNNKAVFIPKGVANSICVIGTRPVHYLYLIDEYYSKDRIKGIAWDDLDLAIDWPIKKPIISDRDKKNPKMRELFPKRYKKK